MSDQVSVAKTPHWVRLTIPAELDLRHWAKLQEICNSYAGNRRFRWLLDMRHTHSIRDSGLAALICLKHTVCGRSKPLPVTNASPQIRDELTRLGLI